MKTLELPSFTSGIPDDLLADLENVCQTLASGQPIEPELRRRLREEGDRVREEIFQMHGLLDIGVPAIRELRDGE